MSDITANIVVSMPSQLFTMPRSFKAVANGKIYIGQIDTDPVNPANQIPVYLENEDGSHVQVAQPIVINTGGYPVYNGQIAKFVTVQGHSMAVYDAYGTQQFYYPNVLKYDPDQLHVELDKGYGGLYLRRTTVAEIATGTFPVGAQLAVTDRAGGHFTVVSGGTANGTYILNAGNGNTAVYQIPADGYARVKALGGRSGVDSTAAIVAAHSLSNLVHYDDDDVYELSYDVNTSNKSLISYSNQNYVRITGSSATIKDVSAFSSGVSFLVNIFRFSSCTNVFVGVNFDANPLADITAPSPDGIGYKGSTAIYLEGFCNNVKVDNVMSNVRYGVRIGGYSDPSLGGSRNISLRTRCFQVGYPIAAYTALNLDLDIYSNIQHRAAYLGGTKNVSGNISLAGFTYATISVLLTDSIRTVSGTDADRRVNSCQNVYLNINDNGSTGTTSARALWGMQQEWKAPNLDHQDIHCHINMATNNAARTYAAVRIQEIDTIGWMAGNKYTNIKCSGVVDRSSQSSTGSSWADYSIVGIAAADVAGPTYPNSPVFDGIDFSELRIINGGVTGNLSQILAPNATGVINLKNARQGISLSTQAPNARIILTNASFSSVTGVGVIYPSINKSSNGYRVDDDGNIEQWMQVNYTASAGSAQSFTFPVPFTASCRSVAVTVIGTGSVTSTGTPTTSGVSISCSTTGVSLFIRVTGF